MKSRNEAERDKEEKPGGEKRGRKDEAKKTMQGQGPRRKRGATRRREHRTHTPLFGGLPCAAHHGNSRVVTAPKRAALYVNLNRNQNNESGGATL